MIGLVLLRQGGGLAHHGASKELSAAVEKGSFLLLEGAEAIGLAKALAVLPIPGVGLTSRLLAAVVSCAHMSPVATRGDTRLCCSSAVGRLCDDLDAQACKALSDPACCRAGHN